MEKTELRVKLYEDSSSLDEIYQKTGIMFAFVSSIEDGLEMCHQWVKCKDFLADAVRTQLTGNKFNIYGFHFSIDKNPPVDLNVTRIAVSTEILDDLVGFEQKMISALKLINHFEDYMGVPLSRLDKVDITGSSKKAIYLFTGPQEWIKSPFLISMYSFLIRLGDKNFNFSTIEELKKQFEILVNENSDTLTGAYIPIEDNDTNYLATIGAHIHNVLNNRNKLFNINGKNTFHPIYFENLSENQFHNNMGILSLLNTTTSNEGLNTLVKEIILQKK